MPRLTGERPMQGSTPDSLLAFHDAGYREVRARLDTGLVLDVGCGVGDETERLGGPGRSVVGVDYDAETAVLAGKHLGHEALRFAAMDGKRLGFRDGAFDSVCSSHIIEHFTDPEAHVAEVARVLAPGGTAFVITPNRPADFENPFHVYLFESAELGSLLRVFFDDVEVLGLEGDDALKADFAVRPRSSRARGTCGATSTRSRSSTACSGRRARASDRDSTRPTSRSRRWSPPRHPASSRSLVSRGRRCAAACPARVDRL
jgi:SAM-dependent methyltransferase